jgi:hypothetical protein
MKHIYIIGLINTMIASVCLGQQYSNVALNTSVSGLDRMDVVKNSIKIDEWHEKSFWPLYAKYASKVDAVSMQAYRTLNDLALVDKSMTNGEAYDYGTQLISFRHELLTILQQYYAEIGSEFNGIVALQFLQTEALLDMMESSRIYETTPLKQYRFHPKLLPTADLKSAKYNIISKALSLTPEEAPAFYAIYARYEEECDALLGDDYSLVGFYAGEASDYTPAIAKRLGYDFLNVLKRELKLKEIYFNKVNSELGGSLAARFLAWEDYYSNINKMYAWADAP